jgi:hypothetical protein
MVGLESELDPVLMTSSTTNEEVIPQLLSAFNCARILVRGTDLLLPN